MSLKNRLQDMEVRASQNNTNSAFVEMCAVLTYVQRKITDGSQLASFTGQHGRLCFAFNFEGKAARTSSGGSIPSPQDGPVVAAENGLARWTVFFPQMVRPIEMLTELRVVWLGAGFALELHPHDVVLPTAPPAAVVPAGDAVPAVVALAGPAVVALAGAAGLAAVPAAGPAGDPAVAPSARWLRHIPADPASMATVAPAVCASCQRVH